MSTHLPCAGTRALFPLRKFFASLMRPVFAMLLLVAAAPDAAQAVLPVLQQQSSPDMPRINDPSSLVQRYLQAVDRGELVVFGHVLDRSMIVPVRVEYIYELSSQTTRIRVYSNLTEPLPVPGQTDCRILGVSAVMEDGSITEIESHIWMK
jgi:hypothetical protein